jgi:hypothetical protein
VIDVGVDEWGGRGHGVCRDFGNFAVKFEGEWSCLQLPAMVQQLGKWQTCSCQTIISAQKVQLH